jgi:hypothetical protein
VNLHQTEAPKNLIPGWVHHPGHHCGSTALSDVITYCGMPLSEPMCFGLGAGLGFHYTEWKGINPSRMFHVRSSNLEGDFFTALGIPFEWKTSTDPEEALNLAKTGIDHHHPVLLRTDIYYLDYYKSSTHFSGHLVVLWGYDDEKKNAYLSDTGWPELQAISYDHLANARMSKAPPIPLDNQFFEVDVQPPFGPLERGIVTSMKKNASQMLEPRGGKPIYSYGIEGMEILCQRLPTWAEAHDWKWCARFAYQIIEKRGTGGAAFRNLYQDFLREAEDILPWLRPYRLQEKMASIARAWIGLAEIFKEISESETPQGFERVIHCLRRLAQEEKSFYQLVLEIPVPKDSGM